MAAKLSFATELKLEQNANKYIANEQVENRVNDYRKSYFSSN